MDLNMDLDDFTLAHVAPSDPELRQLVDHLMQKEADSLYPERTMRTTCVKCGGFCPSGTLENGLCNDCDLIGKRILVSGWGRWGMQSCLVTRVSRNGTIYAKRWFKYRGRWSAERPVHYYKGVYRLGSRE